MNIIAIIPARMGSSRFPGKPLARLHGVPMLGHVYFRTRLNSRLSGVYIATCDDEIRAYAESIGAACVITSREHTRASDRTAEAAGLIEQTSGPIDAVVMVQGDEPMLVPSMIDEAILPLAGDAAVQVVNLMAPIGPDDAADPNEVKVAVDLVSGRLAGAALDVFEVEPPPGRQPAVVPAELLPRAPQRQQQRHGGRTGAREHDPGSAGRTGAGAAAGRTSSCLTAELGPWRAVDRGRRPALNDRPDGDRRLPARCRAHATAH